MGDKIEMSLDEIIKTTNIGKRRPNGRANGGGPKVGGRPRPANGRATGGGRTQGGGVAKGGRNSGGRPGKSATSPRGGGGGGGVGAPRFARVSQSRWTRRRAKEAPEVFAASATDG